MNINYLQYSATGDRDINQDYCVKKTSKNGVLFITADGMGGHQAGERISRAFCEQMLSLAEKYSIKMQSADIKQTLLNWFNQAINDMAEKYKADTAMQKAHTTCALLWLDNQQVITAHIGDARIYRISDNAISRTRDHSVPQMLLDEGEISEADLGNHPDQNRLTRSISLANKHQPTIKVQPVANKQETFILCSDGFWSNTTQQEFIQLSHSALTEQDLIKQAKTAISRAKGESDNVTVQWIRVEKTP